MEFHYKNFVAGEETKLTNKKQTFIALKNFKSNQQWLIGNVLWKGWGALEYGYYIYTKRPSIGFVCLFVSITIKGL